MKDNQIIQGFSLNELSFETLVPDQNELSANFVKFSKKQVLKINLIYDCHYSIFFPPNNRNSKKNVHLFSKMKHSLFNVFFENPREKCLKTLKLCRNDQRKRKRSVRTKRACLSRNQLAVHEILSLSSSTGANLYSSNYTQRTLEVQSLRDCPSEYRCAELEEKHY